MANISSLTELNQRQDWHVIDHSLFAPDLRVRLVKR